MAIGTPKSIKHQINQWPDIFTGVRPFSFMTNKTRKLKIEEAGDIWKGFKPKLRIMGRWLERAGFKPGNHVQIICTSPGVMEVRSLEPANAAHFVSSHHSSGTQLSNVSPVRSGSTTDSL
jgi:hypothetical protein